MIAEDMAEKKLRGSGGYAIARGVKNSTKAHQQWYLTTQMKSLEKASHLLKRESTSARHVMLQSHNIASSKLLIRHSSNKLLLPLLLFKLQEKKRRARLLLRLTLLLLQELLLQLQLQVVMIAFSHCNHLLACLPTIA